MRDFCTDYAEALFSLAQEEDSQQIYFEQLQTIAHVIDDNEDFVKFLGY